MTFIQFKSALSAFSVFSLADIRTIYPNFDRRRLTEWQHKGYIRKITKGLYTFSDIELNEEMLFYIANKLYRPSYISLETALSYYQLIPEAVYSITSVCTRKTNRFDTPVGYFSYRTISPKLFYGYEITSKTIKIASIEKTLIDFFYLNTQINTVEAFDSLRIDRKVLIEQLDEKKLKEQLEIFDSKALTERITHFLEWLNNAHY
jgi:predicted transcriptional regulator of viral defense system